MGGVGVLGGEISSTRLHTCCSWSSFTGFGRGRTADTSRRVVHRSQTSHYWRQGGGAHQTRTRSALPAPLPCLARPPGGKLRKCRGLVEQHWCRAWRRATVTLCACDGHRRHCFRVQITSSRAGKAAHLAGSADDWKPHNEEVNQGRAKHDRTWRDSRRGQTRC